LAYYQAPVIQRNNPFIIFDDSTSIMLWLFAISLNRSFLYLQYGGNDARQAETQMAVIAAQDPMS
jgi:hypothetical protein